jgi:hypothetical protein
MRIDKKDLALLHVIKDSRYPSIACRGNRSYATDGYVFAEYISPRRDGSTETIFLAAPDCTGLRKSIPSNIKAVKAGDDFIEVEAGRGVEDETRDLITDKATTRCLKELPQFVFSLDPDLLARATRFLFDGHGGTEKKRKALCLKVFRLTATIRGQAVTYPVYELTNKNDDTRRCVLAGLKDD